ncbi:MAG: polyprenyl diphosphate synthase, partial [Promethearchaeota archaeon]
LNQITTLTELHKQFSDYLPRHVGLILDGNRRWIRRQGIRNSLKGHMAGYIALKNIIDPCFDAGIRDLSIYALSTENIKKRSKKEINYLYKLLTKGINEVLHEKIIHEKEVCIRILGRTQDFPNDLQEGIKEVMKETEHYSNFFCNICLNYDGQLEIVDAVKNIIQKGIPASEITKETIKQNLYSFETPEADYIIRTGMDDGARISGFLLWDASYAEFRFRNELWPDYNKQMLLEDLKEYIRRNRRKGA